MHIEVAGISNLGTKRSQNDDHYCIGQWVEQGAMVSCFFGCDSAFFQEYGLLAAVTDGLGGYEGGSYASRIALEILRAQFYGEQRVGYSRDEFAACMKRHLAQMQTMLSTALKRREGFSEAGTTIAGIAMMPPDFLVIFHAGDSRVMRASGGFPRALTIDHSLIGRDVAEGRVTEQEAASIPGAFDLTRSLGVNTDYEVEISTEYSWATGDKFLIGTDGWFGVARGLPLEIIQETLREEQDCRALVTKLVVESVRLDGRDNSTLVIVRVVEAGDGHDR
jgi:protein phosphatase